MEAYGRRLRAYARHTRCSEDEVEEILWDVWALAADSESSFVHVSDAWPLLKALVQPVCAARVRNWRREVRADPLGSMSDLSHAGLAAQLAMQAAWDSWWDGAWKCLGRQERLAVDFRFRWGWDYPYIAAGLEVNESTARSYVARGLARLRNYAEEFPPPA